MVLHICAYYNPDERCAIVLFSSMVNWRKRQLQFASVMSQEPLFFKEKASRKVIDKKHSST